MENVLAAPSPWKNVTCGNAGVPDDVAAVREVPVAKKGAEQTQF
jgi:hypothetical protein